MKKFFLFNLMLFTLSFANSQSLQMSFNDVRDLSLSVSDRFNLMASEYITLESSTVNEGGWAWRNYNTEKDSFFELATLSQNLTSDFAALYIHFENIANDFANFDGSYSSLSGLPSLFDGSFSSLSGTPTTLAGYGITDAFDGSYPSLTDRIFYYDSNNNNGIYSNQGNTATGTFSFAIGSSTSASGSSAVSLNHQTAATGNASLAIGSTTQSIGENSFAGGLSTQSTGYSSAALGRETVASGNHSLSIGQGTNSHAFNSVALGQYNSVSTTANPDTYLTTNTALVIGNGTDTNNRSNAFKVLFDGTTTIAGSVTASSFVGDGSGLTSLPLVVESITEGGNTGVRLSSANAANHGDIGNTAVDLSYQSSASTTTGATGQSSFAVGLDSTASGASSISGGYLTIASGDASVALGNGAQAAGTYSYSIGHLSKANGDNSVALGFFNESDGQHATSMGKSTKASGNSSTSIGDSTTASGVTATAMGESTTASGYVSLALGKNTTSSAEQSIAAGYGSIAEGNRSTALGLYSKASGTSSTAMGLHTVSESPSSLVIGTWNELNSGDEQTLFVIGNGGWDATRENYLGTEESRSNALKVLVDGTTTIAGDLSINSDARLKANIVSLGATLSKLLQIDGKSYTMKKDKREKQKIGLLAQDIEKVFPELVSESNGIKSVNYQGLVPVLINALKEQDVFMKEQQRILSVQQSELDELKSMMKKIIER